MRFVDLFRWWKKKEEPVITAPVPPPLPVIVTDDHEEREEIYPVPTFHEMDLGEQLYVEEEPPFVFDEEVEPSAEYLDIKHEVPNHAELDSTLKKLFADLDTISVRVKKPRKVKKKIVPKKTAKKTPKKKPSR